MPSSRAVANSHRYRKNLIREKTFGVNIATNGTIAGVMAGVIGSIDDPRFGLGTSYVVDLYVSISTSTFEIYTSTLSGLDYNKPVILKAEGYPTPVTFPNVFANSWGVTDSALKDFFVANAGKTVNITLSN